MTKTTKISLAVIAAVVLALGGGYLGAGLRGGSAQAATSGSWLESIKESGKLRVGVALAPPMTTRVNGELGGPNLIPLENLAKELGVKLVTVPAKWSTIVAGLQADRYDVAANLDPTLQRATSIQFSTAVYEYQGVFVVRGDSPLCTVEDIINSGKPVATAKGSSLVEPAKAAGAKLLKASNYTNALQAVIAGRASAVFTDLPTAESQVQTHPKYKIVVPNPPIYETGSGYGLPEDIDQRSLNLINIAIKNARMSGQLQRAYAAVDYHTIDNLGDMQKEC